MRLRVPSRATIVLLLSWALLFVSAAIPATKKPPSHPIDINSASAKQLQEVPGIGPATAEKILQMRKSYGAFKSVDDLLSVRGIGPKRLEKMRKYLVAGHTVPRRGTASSAIPEKGAGCQNCSRPGHVASGSKKTAVSTGRPATVSKQASSSADVSEPADEEPE
jgi:competence ComEA-like helix-hairpin-helix protein